MMGWGWNEGWHTPFFGLGPLLFVLIVVGLIVYFARSGRMSNGPTARDILDRRYASGEITREQYDQMKRDLAA